MKTDNLSYRAAAERLEEIVQCIEHDTPDVDELSSFVEEAVELTKFCRAKLSKADKHINEIMSRLDETPEELK